MCKSGGSQKLAHMPRTRRIDASAIAEQLSGYIVDLVYERTHSEAADIGTKRFEQLDSWAKVLYLIQVVAPTFWDSNSYPSYLESIFAGDNGGFTYRAKAAS